MIRLESSQKATVQRGVFISAAALATGLAIVLLWAWRFPQAGDNTALALRNGASRCGFLLATVLVLVVMLRSLLSSKAPHLLPLLLLVLFWFDIRTHEPEQNPGVPPWVYQRDLARGQLKLNPEPSLGRSRAMVSAAAQTEFRTRVLDDPKDNYLVKRMGFFADCNLLDSVPKVDGFFSLCPRECGELNSALYVSGMSCGAGLPDFLSVSQLSAARGEIKWTARDTFLPLATGGQRAVFLDDTNALLTILSGSFDPRQIVVLPPETQSLVASAGETRGPVAVKVGTVTARQVDLEVDAAGPGIVVAGQTYYHQWHAFVDGKPTPLLRANYAFQAVLVPPGKHHVRLRYQDHALQLGAVISALALMTALVMFRYPSVRPP